MQKTFALLCVAALALAGCASRDTQRVLAGPIHASDRTVLRVSLFPWIPDREGFAAWIESEFERKHPGIDLIVRPMKYADADDNDLAYDYATTIKSLTTPADPDYQDLVEVDTIILGKLVEAQAIQATSIVAADYYDFARQAVTIDGVVYGVPHWSCGYFIITGHQSVADAGTAEQLKIALSTLGTTSPDLGGDVIGSWGSIVSYLDAYVDTYPRGDLAAALTAPTLDRSVAASLSAIGSACSSSGKGLCDRSDDALVTQFGAGGLDALVGYSERLNVLFSDPTTRMRPDTIKITPAPFGSGKTAFFFTDAVVRSAKCNSARCADAAAKFSAFYSSAAVMAASMMSADKGKGAVPRYLLPATRKAMQNAGVKRDPVYRQLDPLLAAARPYPNQGIPEAKATKVIRAAVDPLLQPAGQ